MDEPTEDEAARRYRARELRAEAEMVAADPDDRVEAAAILEAMENLREEEGS